MILTREDNPKHFPSIGHEVSSFIKIGQYLQDHMFQNSMKIAKMKVIQVS